MKTFDRFAIPTICLVLLALFSTPPSIAAQAYVTAGDCAGFPRVDLKTPPGTCIGLVAAHLGFARGVVTIGKDVFVADMGGWRRNHGRILKLADGGHGSPQILLSNLDEPNSLALGPGGTIYVGLSGKVIQFDPAAADLQQSVRDIIVNLPTDGRHPLAAIALAHDGSLFVNIGSASDHCEKGLGESTAAPEPCPETITSPPRGSILHITPAETPIDAHTVAPYARGLRNSMALVALDSGQLIAAVNARDAIHQADPALADAEFPHDTLVRVDTGADYGWPYCFDENRPSPEYRQFDCSKKHAPSLLLPAHSAPLGMIVYNGNVLPGLDGKLLIGYHGYRPTGHRIVSLAIDKKGMPQKTTQDIVYGWDYIAGSRPQGTVVALWEKDDGSVLITEDSNGTLLRLAHDGP